MSNKPGRWGGDTGNFFEPPFQCAAIAKMAKKKKKKGRNLSEYYIQNDLGIYSPKPCACFYWNTKYSEILVVIHQNKN